MDTSGMINILLWLGAISGTFLMFLMLVSIFLGTDSDADIETDNPDSIDGHGSFGMLKSALTFISISSFTIRAILLNSAWSWPAAILSGLVAGGIAVVIIGLVFRLLLKNQESGNWSFQDAVAQVGSVYIPIPEKGTGKIIVPINGINREVEARSDNGEALPTDTKVLVLETIDEVLVVTAYKK